MKKIFFIEASKADQVTYYHLLVFVVTLPFDRLYSELALISLAVHTLIHFRKENFRQVALRDMVIPASLYLVTMIGTVYSPNKEEAFAEWERQAALLLFPLIISFNKFEFRKYTVNLCMALGFSCALAIAALYVVALHTISSQHLPFTSLFTGSFSNHNFAAPIDMHATYFSMYISLGAAAMVYFFVREARPFEKVVSVIVFIVLLAGLIQLSSRAVLVAFCAVMLVVVPLFILTRKQRTGYWMVSLVTAIVLIFTFTRMDFIKSRFTAGLREDLTARGDMNHNSQEPRIVRWRAAMPLMLASPIWGHGSGTEIPLLKEVYFQKKLYNSYLESLNIHNQYLSMIIQTGIIGLLFFLWVLLAGFGRAIRTGDGLFCAFLVTISIVCFSENILDGNKGIFFFACFFSLFYIHPRSGSLKNKIVAVAA